MTQSPQKVIILGWYLGMGALIQSSVNSIWLAKKLGREYYLHWGHSCIYQPGMIGSSCKSLGNIYPKLFVEPADHAGFATTISQDMFIYPHELNQISSCETIDEFDANVASIASGQTLPLRAEDINSIMTTQILAIYQYLSISDAVTLARAAGFQINESLLSQETAEIYRNHFRLRPETLRVADDFWTANFPSDSTPVGIHIRGSDKITETPIPSPTCYFHCIDRFIDLPLTASFFVATDQGSCLDAFRHKYLHHHIAFQNIIRAHGDVGLHFSHQRSDYAFQHALDVILDVELLSRCSCVFAFPGSQIYWWLNIKRRSEALSFDVYDVMPGFFDKYKALLYAFQKHGCRAFMPLLIRPLVALKRFGKSLLLKSS